MATTRTAAETEKVFGAENDATGWIALGNGDALSVSITGDLDAGTTIALQHTLDTDGDVQTIKTYTESDVFEHEVSMPPGLYRLICTAYAEDGTPKGVLWN